MRPTCTVSDSARPCCVVCVFSGMRVDSYTFKFLCLRVFTTHESRDNSRLTSALFFQKDIQSRLALSRRFTVPGSICSRLETISWIYNLLPHRVQRRPGKYLSGSPETFCRSIPLSRYRRAGHRPWFVPCLPDPVDAAEFGDNISYGNT